MMPSLTLSVSAGRAKRLAPWSTSSARASAQASRIAVPPFSIDRLPDVWPSSGVRAVSPEIIWTRVSGRSSSSAAICANAVKIPCPSSTLPVKIVAEPSASMRSQASSMRFLSRLPGSFPGAAHKSGGTSVKLSTSAPAAFPKSRRVSALMACPYRAPRAAPRG